MIKYIIAAIAINSFASESELREKFCNLFNSSQIYLVFDKTKDKALIQRKNDLEEIKEDCLKQVFENEKTQQPLKGLLEIVDSYKKNASNSNLNFQILIEAETNHLDFIRYYCNNSSGIINFCKKDFNEKLTFTEQLDNVCIKIDDEGTTIILHHNF